MSKYETVVMGNEEIIEYESRNKAEIAYDRFVWIYGDSHVTLRINGINMPHYADGDDRFFYASMKAAEEGKIWVEEVHNFCDQEVIDTLEFDEDVILDNIMLDIDYESVTGNDGEAIVKSEKVAKICENDGYKVTAMNNYWVIER